MDVMFERVAGLDVGKDSVTVCLRTPGGRGRRHAETRTFKTMFGSLRVMRDWLVENGVAIAAMGAARRVPLPGIQTRVLVATSQRQPRNPAPYTSTGSTRTSVHPTSPDGTRVRFSSPSAAIRRVADLYTSCIAGAFLRLW